MKIFMFIAGAILIAGGLLLCLASPILGIIFILLGVISIFGGKKYKPKSQTQTFVPVEEQNKQTYVEPDRLLVAGFDHHQPALRSLLTDENPDYDLPKKQFVEEVVDRAYQFYPERYDARLEHEDNEYDPNAIAVYVDDIKIGYIARKDQSIVDMSKSYEVEIFGGKYKECDYSETDLDGNPENIIKDETPVKARIYEV